MVDLGCQNGAEQEDSLHTSNSRPPELFRLVQTHKHKREQIVSGSERPTKLICSSFEEVPDASGCASVH